LKNKIINKIIMVGEKQKKKTSGEDSRGKKKRNGAESRWGTGLEIAEAQVDARTRSIGIFLESRWEKCGAPRLFFFHEAERS
jgi:hypothetical protein